MDSPLSTPNTAWKKKPPLRPLTTLTPKLKMKKTKASWEHDWAFPLAGWNYSSQNSLSQFFAWANTPCKEHPNYIGEKGRILGKRYGFEIRCYWEHPWGTHWEIGDQLGNMVGTQQQLQKERKKNLPVPSPKTQIKKLGPLSGCYTFPLGTCKFFFQNC
jgi:hypothetical protein